MWKRRSKPHLDVRAEANQRHQRHADQISVIAPSKNSTWQFARSLALPASLKKVETQLTAAELVYTRDIKRLRELISSYLHRKQSAWVMFDNLDQGWSTLGVDAIDAAVLRGLVDAGRKIERK